jgi:hypothetical protein
MTGAGLLRDRPLRYRRHCLLDGFEDLAPTRNPVAPDSIEIGNERRDAVRVGRRTRLIDIDEFVKRVMNLTLRAAPAAPTAPRPKDPDCPRQVIGGVPMIERRAVCLVRYLGAHPEMSCTH